MIATPGEITSLIHLGRRIEDFLKENPIIGQVKSTTEYMVKKEIEKAKAKLLTEITERAETKKNKEEDRSNNMVFVGSKRGIAGGYEYVFGKKLVREVPHNRKGIKKSVYLWTVHELVEHIKKVAVPPKGIINKLNDKVSFLKMKINS